MNPIRKPKTVLIMVSRHGVSSCWRIGFAGLAWLALGAVLVVGGCRGAVRANLNDLFISKQRYNLDENKGIVRIYAMIENTGQAHFKQVEVHAILRSAGGEKRGENNVLLQNIRPLEKRTFSLTVTSHAPASDVVLEIRKPVQP